MRHRCERWQKGRPRTWRSGSSKATQAWECRLINATGRFRFRGLH